MSGEETATPTAPSPAKSMPSVSMVASALVLAWSLWLRWGEGTAWPLVDVEVFTRGAQSLLAGQDLYSSPPGALPFTYPPFAAVAFLPLGFAGVQGAAWIISSWSILAYATAIGVSACRARVSLAVAFVVGAGGLALEPVVRNLVLGQVNLILMAMVLIDAFIVPRRFRGILTGVASGVKLTPAFFAIYFAVRRDWNSLARCVGTFFVSVLVGFIVATQDSWHYWRSFFGTERFGYEAVTPMNQSVRALLARATGLADPPVYLFLPALIFGFVLSVAAAAAQVSVEDEFASLLCIAGGSLLLSPVSWTHHWVWVVPALFVVIERGWAKWGWIAGALLFFAPMWAVPTGGGRDLHLNAWQLVVSGCYVCMALLFLVVMCLPLRRSHLVGKRL